MPALGQRPACGIRYLRHRVAPPWEAAIERRRNDPKNQRFLRLLRPLSRSRRHACGGRAGGRGSPNSHPNGRPCPSRSTSMTCPGNSPVTWVRPRPPRHAHAIGWRRCRRRRLTGRSARRASGCAGRSRGSIERSGAMKYAVAGARACSAPAWRRCAAPGGRVSERARGSTTLPGRYRRLAQSAERRLSFQRRALVRPDEERRVRLREGSR